MLKPYVLTGRPRRYRIPIRRRDINLLRGARQHRGGQRGDRAGLRRASQATQRGPRHLHSARQAGTSQADL